MLIAKARVLMTLLVLIAFSGKAQILISDDFSDGDHSSNPTWVGDGGFFGVTTDGRLRLTDSLAGSRSLSLSSPISLNASWQWSSQLEFNPSSSNYMKVYLLSDNRDLSGPLNGYYLRVGGSSADDIGLFRQDGTNEVLLAQSSPGWVNQNLVDITIRVTRDAQFNWIVMADTSAAQGNLQSIASANDSTWLFSSWFGLSPQYTKTRSDRFYWDDISLSGNPFIDSVAAEVVFLTVLDSVHLQVGFNEPLDSISALDPANYGLSGGLKLDEVTLTDQQIVLLLFKEGLVPNQLYHLTIMRIKERAGNEMDSVLSFRYAMVAPGDIVINELMPDPSPSVGIPPWNLPEAEYVELHNNLPWPVGLANWKLVIGAREFVLPAISIDSAGYLIIAGEQHLAGFGDSLPIVGLDMPATVLTNSGSVVKLLDQKGQRVSSVSYDQSFYQNALKAQGGWSLERIHPKILCEDRSNWQASEDQNGGTPGRPNSLDSTDYKKQSPEIGFLWLQGYDSITIGFSVPLDRDLKAVMDALQINPPLSIETFDQPGDYPERLNIRFEEELSPGVTYQLFISPGLRACNGRAYKGDTLRFGLPELPDANDIKINELLFNPFSGGVDFVELHNVSDKIVDLSRLRLGNWDQNLQMVVKAISVSDESILFFPGEFISVSEDGESLQTSYPKSKGLRHISISDLPSLPDDEGSIALETTALSFLDNLIYSKEMHHPLLSDAEGVSLERLSCDISSENPTNWHSASGIAGFATPGYRNSQNFQGLAGGGLIIQPRIFSPDMDGIDDVLSIQLPSISGGLLAKLSVWSFEGRLVKLIDEQILLGSQGVLFWDGSDDQGRIQKPGIYLIIFETFGVNEKRRVHRGTCVLSP